MKKYIKYLVFTLLIFIGFKINVNAENFKIQIDIPEDIRNQYSDYSLIITGRTYGDSPTSGTYTVIGSGDDNEITFDENGVAHLNISLSQNSNLIEIADLGESYNRLKVEFDSTKESTKKTGQSPLLDDDKILGGYFIEGGTMQMWNIESLNTKIDIPFKKYFEDTGFENYRPASNSFKLYDKKNMNTVVDTTEITYGNNSIYEFDGEFTNIPKYDNNGELIEYTIKEDSIPYYTNSTDSNHGLRIKFNEQAKLGYSSILKMYYKDNLTGNMYRFVIKDGGLGDDFGGKTLELAYPISGYDSTPTRDWAAYVLEVTNLRSVEELVGKVYPESSHPYPLGESHAWHYKNTISGHSQEFFMTMRTESWGGYFGLLIDNITTMGNDTILTSTINLKDLEVTKKWEDDGYESYRPNSVTYDIYNSRDMNTIVKTVTLNKNDNEVDDNTWKLTVPNLTKYDEDSQEIEYTIIERPVENYFQVYDYTDDYNALAVTYSDDTFLSTYQCYTTSNDFLGGNCLVRSGNSYYNLNYNDMQNGVGLLNGKTVYFPTKYVKIMFSVEGGRSGFPSDFIFNGKIVDIHLVKVSSFASNTSNLSNYNTYDLGVHTYEDYFDFHDRSYGMYGDKYEWKYEWKGSTKPKKNATVVRNLINLKDVKFTKKWDDADLEEYRPESIKFRIYNENNPNTLVKEITLTSANEKEDDSTIWEGTFKDVPKYNEDGSEAKYIIKEEKLDLYTTKYDISNFKGFIVEFDENSYASNFAYFAVLLGNNRYYSQIKYQLKDGSSNTFNDMKNRKIYVPTNESRSFLLYYSNNNATDETNYGFKIKSVKPVTDSGLNYSIYDNSYSLAGYNVLNFAGDEYPESEHPFDSYSYYKYTLEPVSNSFTEADIIINKANIKEIEITKIWDDEGYEDRRPNEIIFNVYNRNDLNNVVKEFKLTKDDVDRDNPNKWNGKVKGLKKLDNNGNEIEYVIEEVNNNKYTSSKEGNEFTNKILLYTAKVLKTDNNDNPLKGAKIKVVDENGVELYSFESTTQEKVLTLPIGEYTLIEEEAPEGYIKSNDVKFSIDKDGKIIIDEAEVDTIKIVNRKVEVKDASSDNPKTLDNITKYVILFSISSLLAIIGYIIYKNKKVIS